MARLVYRDSQGREGTLELSPTETVYVGRGLECAIRTDDGMVSRRHSQIRMEAGRYVIEDLGSANGTHLNNTRIQKQALGHSDVMQCGSLTLRFLDEGAVGVLPQQVQPMAAPPQKKGGTMVLDRGAEAPPLSSGPPPGMSPPAMSGLQPQYGMPGASPSGASSTVGAMGNMPAPNLPYGGPPGMPGAGGPPGGMPGGPQSMPGGAPGMPGGNPPSMFGSGRPGFGGSAAAAKSSVAGMPMPGGAPGAAPYGGPPSMPGAAPGGSSPNNLPYGGPPGMPGGGAGGGALPYGGPPIMPGGGAAPGGAAAGLPYGGPPIMPGGGAAQGAPARGNDPSIFGRGGPVGAPGGGAPAAAPRDPESNVMVDLGLEFDPQKADKETKALKAELDKSNANYEREVADGKRVRAEAASLRDRIEELRAAVKDREEQAAAHDRVADELRDELASTRDELGRTRTEMTEIAENMATRDRQVARAQEEASKIREDMEDVQRQMLELSRTKDEGWKKLNEQLSEIEHLREVINEQERMLEERRIGLISQEEVIKELRSDKEKSFKQIAQLKAERDEAATTSSRMSAQIVAIEEENKRLGRLMVEAQTDAQRGGGGSSASGDQVMRMTNDMKELRVELKKVEADRDRLVEQYERAERDRQKFEGRLAQIEVELQEAAHGKLAAESARNVAQDALAKAEVARHKAAEEALNASKARDQASTGGDDARREIDKLRKKVTELETKGAAAPAISTTDLQNERDIAQRKLNDATSRAEVAERSIKVLQAETDAAKTDAAKARAEAARVKAAADSSAEEITQLNKTVAPPSAEVAEIARAAQEVHDAINDILSDMRNNVVLVQGELPHLKSDDNETLKAVADAIEALVDSVETSKGALRGLKQLAEGK